MRRAALLTMSILGLAFSPLSRAFSEPLPTPSNQERVKVLSPDEYNKKALELSKFQGSRIMSIEKVLELQNKNSAILIDLRGKEAFERRHIKGAINVPPEDLTAEVLQKVIPSKEIAIVVYCQNNFYPTRMVPLTTYGFPTLYQLGYENIYELEELWQKRRTHSTEAPSFAGDKDTWGLVPYEGSEAPASSKREEANLP